jgi:hypothetical protein
MAAPKTHELKRLEKGAYLFDFRAKKYLNVQLVFSLSPNGTETQPRSG